jgi:hypothetical protein
LIWCFFLGSEWVDPEDPTVIAETELLGAANSIEAAAKKLALLKLYGYYFCMSVICPRSWYISARYICIYTKPLVMLKQCLNYIKHPQPLNMYYYYGGE